MRFRRNPRKLDQAAEKVFSREVLPLAASLRESGVRFFSDGFEPEAPTYYVRRARRRMAPEDFERGGCASPDELAGELERFWKERNLEPLTRLAAPLARLAATLHAAHEKQDAEVSPFIYVMY